MTIPAGDNFTVTDDSHAWVGSPLTFVHTIQSMFVDANSKLWVMAVDENSSPAGDLYLDSFSLSGGAWTEDHAHPMVMKAFGHGIAFGIEYVSGVPHVWSECDADASGYGQAIATYPFAANSTLHNSDVTQRKPISGASQYSCTYMDTTLGGIVAVRYLHTAHYYQASLASLVKLGLWVNIGAIGGQKEPTLTDPDGNPDTMQGWAASGRYCYIVADDNASTTRDPVLWQVDLNGLSNSGGTDYMAKSGHKVAGSGEPQGVWVGTVNGQASGAPALIYSRKSSGATNALHYLT